MNLKRFFHGTSGARNKAVRLTLVACVLVGLFLFTHLIDREILIHDDVNDSVDLDDEKLTEADIKDVSSQLDKMLWKLYLENSGKADADKVKEEEKEDKSKDNGAATSTVPFPEVPTSPVDAPFGLSDTVAHSHYEAMKLKSYYGMGYLGDDENYFINRQCEDTEYEAASPGDQILYSRARVLGDDMQFLNEFLRETGYGSIIAGEDVDLDNYDFTKLRDWYRFTGSSVWIPYLHCHLMASRVVYSPNKIPVISLIRLQLYDADWNEQKNRRVRYVDANASDMRRAVARFRATGDEASLEAVSMRFPNIMNIDLDASSRSDLLGPEDPRIVYNSRGPRPEPVVVYNQDIKGRRTMFATFPLRRSPSTVKKPVLVLQTSLMGDSPYEKNWMPFFDTLDPDPTWMYMFYGLDPLKVMRCSLVTGYCLIEQQNEKKTSIDRDGHVTSVRGATSLQAVPRRIVQRMLRRDGILDPDYPLQMWVGFVKTHLDACGCGKTVYRPNLAVMVKQENSFRIDLMSGSIDFGKDVTAWDDHTTAYCEPEGLNVLNANEVSMWNISEELPSQALPFDPAAKELPRYSDYMVVTLSEADEDVQVIFLRNIMNYVLGAYRHSRIVLSPRDVRGQVEERNKRVETCMLKSSVQYCEWYGSLHQPPKEDGDEDEEDEKDESIKENTAENKGSTSDNDKPDVNAEQQTNQEDKQDTNAAQS